MTSTDLSDYTLAELKGLLFEVAGAIRERERGHVDEARRRVQAIARDAGLSLDALADDTAGDGTNPGRP